MNDQSDVLTEVDKILIRKSLDLQVTRQKIQIVVIFSSILVVALVIAKQQGASANIFFWVAIIYTTLSTFEKISHALAILAFKRLVQKLIRGIDRKS